MLQGIDLLGLFQTVQVQQDAYPAFINLKVSCLHTSRYKHVPSWLTG